MKTFIVSLKIFLFFTVLTGIIYPFLITGLAQVFFPGKSNGSIIYRNNLPAGSSLIGQKFDTPIYFSSRPSATDYNALPSGGSNLGATSLKLEDEVGKRAGHFLQSNHLDNATVIPAEMLFASASGLDPHISLQSALLQLNTVAVSRNYNEIQKKELLNLVNKHLEPPLFHVFGESIVNVLLLNLDVDTIK